MLNHTCRSWLGTVSLTVLASVAMAGVASAQDTQDDAARAQTGARAASGASDRDIIVTGSRVITNSANSPSQVTVATAADLLDAQPFSLLAGLQALPSITGGSSLTSGMPATIFNLRGIGALRNLVLLDGRRIGPTQSDGSVAVDVVPQALIQRVEVVTGGASAVYGSDAVSGVINFITDRKFHGLRMNVSKGISTYGDDGKNDISIVGGRDLFGGRGHIEGSYEFRNSGGIRRNDRPWLTPNYLEAGSGTAASPYALIRNARASDSSFGGLISSGPLAGLNFTTNGQLTPFVHGTATGSRNVEIGGDGSYYVNPTLEAAQYSHQEFGRFDFDVSSQTHFFVQASVSQTHTSQYGQSLLLNNETIGYNNPYLSTVQSQYQTAIASQLAANPLSSFQMSKMDTLFPQQYIVSQTDYYNATAGLEGKLGGMNWDVAYTRTVSSNKGRNYGAVDNAKLLAALNAVTNPATGQTVCNAALVNPSVYGNCVPINIFGPTSENQAAIDYIRKTTTNEQLWKTNDIAGTLKGAPFSLPAGPVGMALSGEFRRLSLQVKSNAQQTDPVNCTGIQFGCTSTTSPYLGSASAAIGPVYQTVYEAAYEVNVPILADTPFARMLAVNGAARYTHYSTSGGAVTWKVGGDWKINNDIRLRATRSRDIRAPNLNDLYAAPSYGTTQFTDLHTGNTAGYVTQAFAGNPNLVPEKADTITAGIVLTPSFMPGFSFSADYYHIRIKDALVGLNAGDQATQQACEASNGTSTACQLYVRPNAFSDRSAANYPSLIYIRSVNIGLFQTKGVDFEADYRGRLANHPLSLRGIVNYQPELRFDNGPAGVVDVAGAAGGVGGLNATPRWKGVFSAEYEPTSKLRLHLQERWRGPMKQNGLTTLVFADGNIPAIAYTDVTANLDINENFGLSFNIQNLFNKAPSAYASAGGPAQINYTGGFVQGDDVEGRYFTISLHAKM